MILVMVGIGILNILFIYFQSKGKGGRKRGRETSKYGCLLHTPKGDLAGNPGMGPDWELNSDPLVCRQALH